MKFKLTPILIVLSILELFLLFMSINYLFIDNNGGNALGGTIAFFGLIIFFFILLIEQLIIISIKIPIKFIWIIESIIILISIIYVYYNGISIG